VTAVCGERTHAKKILNLPQAITNITLEDMSAYAGMGQRTTTIVKLTACSKMAFASLSWPLAVATRP
jgi:hypothetical protein